MKLIKKITIMLSHLVGKPLAWIEEQPQRKQKYHIAIRPSGFTSMADLFAVGAQEAVVAPDRPKMDPALAHYGPKYDDGADCHWCLNRMGDMCAVIKGTVQPGYACDYFGPVRNAK